MADDAGLAVGERGGRWLLAGPSAAGFGLVNEFLGYLADRGYSPRTVRSYAFDLLALCRWLHAEGVALDAVTTDVLLRYLAACRQATVPGRPGPRTWCAIGDGRRANGYAPATVNHRLAAISGLFEFRRCVILSTRIRSRGGKKEARRLSAGGAHRACSPMWRAARNDRSALRLREPQRLPRGLDNHEVVALVGSLRTWRDRAIAGLMLLSGLRSAEVLGLE